MYHGTIIQIDDCLVSEEILTEYYACDYEKCKGCCCVIGDSGAPMEECEAEAIEKNYHIFSPIMSEEGRAAVAAKGFYEIDMDGDMVTPLVPGSEECAYTLFDENGNIEAIQDGTTATTYYPIPIAALFIGDKAHGGLEAPDSNPIQWAFPPNYSDNLKIVTPSDFNPLTDLIPAT